MLKPLLKSMLHLFCASMTALSICILPVYAADPPHPVVVATQPASPASATLSDAQIAAILSERIDHMHLGVGIVVGVIDASGRRIISHGKTAANQPGTPDGHTLFEIGSVSKVFTSLLLADMVARGEVALTDPVAKYLPKEVKVPSWHGKPIRLQDLASQTSGLPRLPANLAPKDGNNPYADYTVEALYQFLSGYELPREPGSRYEYSNLGVGLLGHALARRAGVDYETLVKQRITQPLGMQHTGITLDAALRQHLSTGHNADLQAVSYWDMPTLAGAGALRSDAEDMLTFLAANLGYAASPLAPAMHAMLAHPVPTGMPGLDVALGWHILKKDGAEIVWHNGGTGGFRSFVGLNRASKVGVVVLCNTGNDEGADDIGRHLLDQRFALLSHDAVQAKAAVAAKSGAAVPASILDNYIGRYELAPTFIIKLTREGDKFYLQATNQPRFELFASDNQHFFLKVVDAQISMEVDANGKATGLILHQNGAHQPARRLQ